jgi:hypothetical protein
MWRGQVHFFLPRRPAPNQILKIRLLPFHLTHSAPLSSTPPPMATATSCSGLACKDSRRKLRGARPRCCRKGNSVTEKESLILGRSNRLSTTTNQYLAHARYQKKTSIKASRSNNSVMSTSSIKLLFFSLVTMGPSPTATFDCHATPHASPSCSTRSCSFTSVLRRRIGDVLHAYGYLSISSSWFEAAFVFRYHLAAVPSA